MYLDHHHYEEVLASLTESNSFRYVDSIQVGQTKRNILGKPRYTATIDDRTLPISKSTIKTSAHPHEDKPHHHTLPTRGIEALAWETPKREWDLVLFRYHGDVHGYINDEFFRNLVEGKRVPQSLGK